MKVVYKKPIVDKLLDAIKEARLNGKEIEKFVLTKSEAYELQRACHFDIFYGVPVEVEGKQ